MKHLLNNINEEEKNSIREQHTGGMKISTDKFKTLLESKLGDSKPLVSEQSTNPKQVAGPFIHKVFNNFKYYIYQEGDKFYLYMSEGDKSPTPLTGFGGDIPGRAQSYPSLDEAKKQISTIFKSFDSIPKEFIPRK